MYSSINVMSLHRLLARTVIWNGYSYAALRQITGAPDRPISMYVEDDVAAAIVAQLARELNVRGYVGISTYGSGGNAFSVGAGLLLAEVDLSKTLILLDGDDISTRAEKVEHCNRVLIGNEHFREEQRKRLRGKVRAFRPEAGRNPEAMLRLLLNSVSEDNVQGDDLELLQNAKSIVNVSDSKNFITKLVQYCGDSRELLLERLARIASKSPLWKRYTRLARVWLRAQRDALNLEHS
jgi:hypothetical protein